MDFELRIIVRLLVAGLFGGLIGLEREYRSKEAGLRTHFLVCLGSALFMIVSQYAFIDHMIELMNTYGPNLQVRADTSRVASQIVSGIGFIGAGTIVLQKRFVVGLTTAAGLWTTAAIGMAVGGGMHIVALAATVLTLAGFEMLRKLSHRIGHLKKEMRVVFYADDQDTAKFVTDGLCTNGRSIMSYSSVHMGDRLYIKVSLDTPERAIDAGALLSYLQKQPGIETESVE